MSCIDHNQKGNKEGYGHSGPMKLHRKIFLETYGYLTQEEADWIKANRTSERGSLNSVPNLAKRFGVDTGTIYNILKGKSHFAYPIT